MSKGHRRRPTEIPLEEADLKWNISFAKTDEERVAAVAALAEYYDKQKSAYIEKRITGM